MIPAKPTSVSEHDLRHVVIGRKNWNLAGSYASAERLANFFTMMQICTCH
ncbi:MAG TPA: hypothetical protein VK465_17385 [Fibrobacteria bacterium]|nr:hypothetical protein [Fibrobacteria bacterium]